MDLQGAGQGTGVTNCVCDWLKPDIVPMASYHWVCRQPCIDKKGSAYTCTNQGQVWEDELQTSTTNLNAADAVWRSLFDKYLKKTYTPTSSVAYCESSPRYPIFQPTDAGPTKGPSRTYYCSGDVPCKRTDPDDGKTSGCTFTKRPIVATSPQGAMVEGGYQCAEEMVKKWKGGWTCYADGLTCVP